MIHLHVEPRVTKTWEAFCDENPPFSIALDGYVLGPPCFSAQGPHVNFDHHAKVDRLSTRSTCMQVYLALTMGLLDTFGVDGEPHAHVYVNDPDQDTCLAVWVLRHPEQCRGLSIGRPLARLLIAEDILDCTGGAYPAGADGRTMKEQGWVFEPYFLARAAGLLHDMDAAGMTAILEAVAERVTAYAAGQGGLVDLDTRYEEIGGGEGWRMIVELGPHARTALFGAGIRAFVAARDNGNGTWTYTVGKMSPYVWFPIQRIYDRLNEAEGCAGSTDLWGGSNTIGGSPRRAASHLSPAQVTAVIEEAMASAARRAAD